MGTVDLPIPRPAPPRPDHEELRRDLVEAVDGEVRFDAGSRGAYAVDSSNYRQVPIGVVAPRTVEAAVAAVAVCRRHDIPLLSRGGGTSLAGQGCNAAVVLDWSRYCTRIVSVDSAARRCVVEPGIKLDDLNSGLPGGLMFGPRPATHVSCTLGGMIGNNSCGSTAQVYGKVADNVRRLEVLTYDGLRMWVGPTTDEEYVAIAREGGRRAEIYRALRELIDDVEPLVRERFPDIPRRVSGYNLDALFAERGFDLARALVGSESTLVTVLHAELELVEPEPGSALVVLGYPDVVAAGRAVPAILPHLPHQLEALDHVVVGFERSKGLHSETLERLPAGGSWLLIEFRDADRERAQARAGALTDELRADEHPPTVATFDDPADEAQLWGVREAALGASARDPAGGQDNWAGWEDAALPPARLGDYLAEWTALIAEFGFSRFASIYGHFGHGCIHSRIPFDLTSAPGVAAFRRFMERSADLVVAHGGSLSGEHGDGQSRGELLERMFGPELVAAFGRLKAVFDPANRMNPGKVVHPDRLDENLRLGAGYAPAEPATRFAYPHDQGRFSRAALRCVGVGKCRRPDSSGGGVMCPSYMVTGAEEHSTRGRARLLWEMLSGHPDSPIRDGWRSTAVRDALDLCLACKGCKSECPVNVDMATYKAEFLHHHYQGRIRPAAHYSMGWLPLLARAASPLAPVVNFATATPGLSTLLKRVAGVEPRRDLPRFASPRLRTWLRRRGGRGDGHRGEVLLWPDTFTDFFSPWVGAAAVLVLEDAGFRVRLPPGELCCGLTWISTGQLGVAQRVLRRTVRALAPAVSQGLPVVALEPSCAAVFRADAVELLPGADTRRLADATRSLGQLLGERAPDWRPAAPEVAGRTAIIQQHCHQHATATYDAELVLLERAGVDAELLDSGCCGLAGNFGFEQGHYEVSQACAERVLLPRVRAAARSTAVLADGFSCRTQIAQGADRRAHHLAELLAGGAALQQLPWPQSQRG